MLATTVLWPPGVAVAVTQLPTPTPTTTVVTVSQPWAWADTLVTIVASAAIALGSAWFGARRAERQAEQRFRRETQLAAVREVLRAVAASQTYVGSGSPPKIAQGVELLQSALAVHGAFLPDELRQRVDDLVGTCADYSAGRRGGDRDPRNNGAVVDRHFGWVRRCAEAALRGETPTRYDDARDRPFWDRRGELLTWTPPDEDPIVSDDGG